LTFKSQVAPLPTVTEIRAQQLAELRDYGVVDAENRIFSIPIEKAEQLVLAELSENPTADVTGPKRLDAAPLTPADEEPLTEPAGAEGEPMDAAAEDQPAMKEQPAEPQATEQPTESAAEDGEAAERPAAAGAEPPAAADSGAAEAPADEAAKEAEEQDEETIDEPAAEGAAGGQPTTEQE